MNFKKNMIVKKILFVFIFSINIVSIYASDNARNLTLLALLVDEAIHSKKNYDLQILPSHQALQEIPSKEEHLELLETFFSNKEQYPDVNIALAHRLTEGYSYAKLAKMLNEARNLAENDSLPTPTMKHINNAILNMEDGYQNKEKIFGFLDKWIHDKRSTAIHEAGHAIAYIYKTPSTVIHLASIEGRSKNILSTSEGGSVHTLCIDDSTINHRMAHYEHHIIACLSGGIAQQVFGLLPFYSAKMLTQKDDILNFINQSEMLADTQNARATITIKFLKSNGNFSSKEINSELIRLYPITYQFIVEHKDAINKVANLLLEKGSIQGDDIYDLLNIDKPLYDFESGPLPKNLENNYEYRGNYEKHQKEVNDLNYKKYVTNIFK